MKKLFIILCISLLTACLLAGCGSSSNLNGIWVMDGPAGWSYEFDGNNYTASTSYSATGTFKVSGDKILFTNSSTKLTTTLSFSKDGDTIKIDGRTYVKQ